METDDRFREQREGMVYKQIQRRGIHNARLLEVMRRVPRHVFVPAALRNQAYEDRPLPIGEGATISQPYMVAIMTDLLRLNGTETVLEIGTGSGYQAAVLASLAAVVHTIEYQPALAHRARAALAELGIQNVYVHIGDGSLGWPPGAPYQAILVTAAAPELPDPLVEQLDEGGILVIPVGGQHEQALERWHKSGGYMHRKDIFLVAFVPLLGQFGWRKKDWDETE